MLEEIPPLFGLYQKRLPGDDALMHLAQRRFDQSKLNPEVYAGSPEELSWYLNRLPRLTRHIMVHLPRELSPLRQEDHARILAIAATCETRILGMVLHDEQSVASKLDDYVESLGRLDHDLAQLSSSVILYVEYAVGLPFDAFVMLLSRIRKLSHVSVCLDIGHVGIRQCRQRFARDRPGIDCCTLTPEDRDLKDHIPALQSAVQSALPTVLGLIEALGAFNKPLHFHLHDGHPLVKSPYGVSDHQSFLRRIPLPFEVEGKLSLAPLFGPLGLLRIVDSAMGHLPAKQLSFTLELHETRERLSLHDGDPLFSHWRDLMSAEQMNHWLDLLLTHASLLEAQCPRTTHRALVEGA